MTTARAHPKLISSPSGGGRRELGFWWGSPPVRLRWLSWRGSRPHPSLPGDRPRQRRPPRCRGTSSEVPQARSGGSSHDRAPARRGSRGPTAARRAGLSSPRVRGTFVMKLNPCLSKIERLAGSGPRLGLGRAFGAAQGAFAGRVRASVAAFRPQALRRPLGASPSLTWWLRPPHPPRVRRRRRTSCFVSFRRLHPQRTGSTLPVRPPQLPRMRPIGAGTRLPPLRSGRQTAPVRVGIVLDSYVFGPNEGATSSSGREDRR